MAADFFSNSGNGLNRLIGLVSQSPDLVGNNDEPSPGRPGTDGFNRSIQRKNIGLLVNRNHRAENAAD
ncbi:hypothetical protein D3C75_1052750 [compost metagenome]